MPSSRAVMSVTREVDKLNLGAKVYDNVHHSTEASQHKLFAEQTMFGSLNHEGQDTALRDAYSSWLQTALSALRVHVFNEMPMQLLWFQKRGSKLDIRLLDRSKIYSHLESMLKDKVQFQDFRTAPLTTEDVSTWVLDVGAYAILSHTWLRSLPGEVIYDDWHQGDFKFDLACNPGCQKLVKFCRIAEKDHGLTLGWMDTVCIDKASSSELDESIRSMFKWYKKAKVCITYLAETTTLSDMAKDPWFTRGWTLQELLAPTYIKFYTRDWEILVRSSSTDKEDPNIQQQIKLATTITPAELMGRSITATYSRKMQWAAAREVTREEDTAYALMGIFNINMSIAYGEGAQAAFIRLVKESLNTKFNVLDILNWAGNYNSKISALIPSSPRAYLQRINPRTLMPKKLMEHLTLTHLGLRVPILLVHAAPVYPSSTQSFRAFQDSCLLTVEIQPIVTNDHPLNPFPRLYNLGDFASFGRIYPVGWISVVGVMLHLEY